MQLHHFNYLKNLLQVKFQWNLARTKFITRLIVALIDAATVNLMKIALKINSQPKYQSKYRNLQRFFQNLK